MFNIKDAGDFRHQIRNYATLILFSTLTLTGVSVHAGKNSLSLQTVFDSGDSRDTFIDLSISLNKKTQLFLGAGNTTSDESSTGAGDEIDLDYLNLGISHKFNNIFTMSLNGSTSGQGREINTRDINTKMTWATDNWIFSLRPQFRKIELLVDPPLLAPRIIDINSTGAGISLGYIGKENWEFFFKFDTYSYDRNLKGQVVNFIINRLSSNAFTVASSLNDSSMKINITRLYEKSDITVSIGQSKSATDSSLLNVANINMNFYHFDPVTLGLELGGANSETNDSSHYMGLTLSYSW